MAKENPKVSSSSKGHTHPPSKTWQPGFVVLAWAKTRQHGNKKKIQPDSKSKLRNSLLDTPDILLCCNLQFPKCVTTNTNHGTCQLCSISHLMILSNSSSAGLAKGCLPHTPPETLQVSATHTCTSAPSQAQRGILLTLCCSCMRSCTAKGHCTAPTANPDHLPVPKTGNKA